MLAIAGPFTISEQNFSNFPQTGARLARVHGLQGKQLSRQSNVTVTGRDRAAKRACRSNPDVEMIVVGQVEAKHDRPCRRGALDHVQPNRFGATVDYQMLAIYSPQHANIG